jgi:hypothetical protein
VIRVKFGTSGESVSLMKADGEEMVRYTTQVVDQVGSAFNNIFILITIKLIRIRIKQLEIHLVSQKPADSSKPFAKLGSLLTLVCHKLKRRSKVLVILCKLNRH